MCLHFLFHPTYISWSFRYHSASHPKQKSKQIVQLMTLCGEDGNCDVTETGLPIPLAIQCINWASMLNNNTHLLIQDRRRYVDEPVPGFNQVNDRQTSATFGYDVNCEIHVWLRLRLLLIYLFIIILIGSFQVHSCCHIPLWWWCWWYGKRLGPNWYFFSLDDKETLFAVYHVISEQNNMGVWVGVGVYVRVRGREGGRGSCELSYLRNYSVMPPNMEFGWKLLFCGNMYSTAGEWSGVDGRKEGMFLKSVMGSA